jgi:nucleotide-binding universal stress UspA family protein
VPTDFSEGSKIALVYAREMADALGASLVILHAYEPCPVHHYTEECELPPAFLESLEKQARGQLEAVLDADQKRQYDATFVLLNGPAPQVMLSYLRQRKDIDLIVMASHGRGGAARLVMGSVADKMVRTAPCPVLIVRATEAAAARTGRAD